MRALFLTAILLLSVTACKTATQQRDPAQAAPHVHGHPPSPQYLAAEEVPRRHSFILLDKAGRFGYHVSEFNSNHQHQYIVRGKLTTNRPLPSVPRYGFFSVTTKEPKFKLQDLIQGKRKKDFPAEPVDVYDGVIVPKPNQNLNLVAKYEVLEQLHLSDMHTDEPRLPNMSFIVFGSDGRPQKTYYMAHLIKRAENFDQLLTIEFDQPQLIANGKFLVLERADQEPLKLKAGETASGQIDGVPVTFKVSKQVYFDIRNAKGFGDSY